jgi:hypothetical protein
VNILAEVKLGGKHDVGFAAPCYGWVDTNFELRNTIIHFRCVRL